MMDPMIDFLYLSEQDMIDAGVLDMEECIQTMEEVYDLISKGDYRMGGKNNNSHGLLLDFPKNPKHSGMPKDGPDRRFMAMPAYLGGDYQVVGQKWYGSNRANIEKGLPRSILMHMINDKDTGAPITLQSANLLSAMRTGAIPGIGVRYLAREDSEVLGLVAAGAINFSSLDGIVTASSTLRKVQIYDINRTASESLKVYANEMYPALEVEIVETLEAAVRGADIVSISASGKEMPFIEENWIEPGALISLPASALFDPAFAIHRTRLVVDNWKLYEAFADELEYPYHDSMAVIGVQFLDWIHEGLMTANRVDNIGDIITGKIEGRTSDDEIIIFGMGGQPVYDVAWGWKIYQNALRQGIGTNLNLWDTPHQMKQTQLTKVKDL